MKVGGIRSGVGYAVVLGAAVIGCVGGRPCIAMPQIVMARQDDPVSIAQARWQAAQAGGAETAAALMARFALAEALSTAGHQVEAEQHWAALAEPVRRLTGKGSEQDVIIQGRWAESLSALGRDREAVAVAQPGLSLAMRRFGPNSLNTERMRLALATAAMRSGRFADALPWLEASLDYNISTGDIDSARAVGDGLARAYSQLDRSAEVRALRLRLAGLAGDEVASPEAREQAISDLGDLARGQKDFAAAVEADRALLDLRRTRLGETDPRTLETEYRLADSLTVVSARRPEDPRTAEAEALYRDVIDRHAVEIQQGANSDNRLLRARAANGLGELLTFTSSAGEARFDEGLALLLDALQVTTTELGEGHTTVQSRLIVAAYFLAQAGRTAESQALLDRLSARQAGGRQPSWETRGMAALIQASLALGSEDQRLETYRQVAAAADAFRSRALETGDAAEMRRSLNDWSQLYQVQVTMAWRAARTTAKAD